LPFRFSAARSGTMVERVEPACFVLHDERIKTIASRMIVFRMLVYFRNDVWECKGGTQKSWKSNPFFLNEPQNI
jgi:hypothetical protein